MATAKSRFTLAVWYMRRAEYWAKEAEIRRFDWCDGWDAAAERGRQMNARVMLAAGVSGVYDSEAM